MYKRLKTLVPLLALGLLGLDPANASDTGLRLGSPLIQFYTNLYFHSQNPTPECPCNVLAATNLNGPITWTTVAQGIPNQTNFNVIFTGNPQFYRLRYKPYIQAPAAIYATRYSACALNSIQLVPFDGTGQLSFSVTNGILSLGNTNGLTFLSGTNGQIMFTVSGNYPAMSNALRTLTYTGYIMGTDTLSLLLSKLGTNGRCGDTNFVRIPLNVQPTAFGAELTAVGQLSLPAPGLLTSEYAYDPDGDPLSLVPQHISTVSGQLELRADGSVSYTPYSTTTTVFDLFSFQVYDTFGGGMHSTSTPQRLLIQIDPVSDTFKVSH